MKGYKCLFVRPSAVCPARLRTSQCCQDCSGYWLKNPTDPQLCTWWVLGSQIYFGMDTPKWQIYTLAPGS